MKTITVEDDIWKMLTERKLETMNKTMSNTIKGMFYELGELKE